MKNQLCALGAAVLLVLTSGCDEDPKNATNNGNPPNGGNAQADSGASTGEADAGGACETWVVEYDLSGSKFDIRNTPFGAGDASNDIGPGTLKIRFPDDNGGLGTGSVTLLSYEMSMNFDVKMVVSALEGEAGPDECGVSSGNFTGDSITWSGPMAGYHVLGTITCNASEVLCAAANLPHEMAKAVDNTTDQALNLFAITSTAGTSSFTMDFVEIPNVDAGDTYLRLVGTETARNCVPAPTCN